MPSKQSLKWLEEGNPQFHRTLTFLTGVTEDDGFSTLTSEERRKLERKLNEDDQE